MDDKTKKDFIELFNQGFEDVVAPQLDDLRKDMEKGFRGVNGRLETVENRLETVENRLETVEMKLDRVAANQLEDRTKIKELQSKIVLS